MKRKAGQKKRRPARPAKRPPAVKGKAAAVKRGCPPEWIRTPADRQAVAEGCWFDIGAAQRVRTFFEKLLKHSKGQFAGKPFALLEWQWRDVIGPVFGWKRPDCTRRFRVAWIEIPKKNGKSTLSSGLALYLLVGDREPGSEVYNGAVDRQQAGIVFDEAAAMVRASPPLRRMLEVIPSRKRIVVRGKPAFMAALSADVESKEGLNAHGVVYDEIHAQKNRKMWDTLRDAGSARRQPLIVVITTAGADRTSIAWELHEYARRVENGDVMDLSWFTYIRAAGPEEDWTSPAVWRKANPSLGITIREEDMADRCQQARQSAGEENNFKRRRLNIWTEQVVRWIRMERWRALGLGPDGQAVDPKAWREEAIRRLKGRSCTGGLDLGSTGDLTAFVLIFGSEAEGYEFLPWYWVPEAGCWRDNGTYRELYQAWMARGFVTVTDGDVTDYNVVRRDLNRLADQFGIEEVAVDRQFQGAQLCTDLCGDGLEMVPFGQGFLSMAAPTKRFEELLLAGKLRHGNHPVLGWNAANASVKCDDAGNMKVIKPARGSPLKVDGIVCCIMALGRLMVKPARKVSVYSRRGVLRV